MTAGGTRAKSWEFDDGGCIRRLLGVLLRTPALPRSFSPSRRRRADWRARKFPRARIPRVHSSCRSRARRKSTAVPLKRIDICIRSTVPAPVAAVLFHAHRPAKDARFWGPRTIPALRRESAPGQTYHPVGAEDCAHERRNAQPERSNSAFERTIECAYPTRQARDRACAWRLHPAWRPRSGDISPQAEAINGSEIRSALSAQQQQACASNAFIDVHTSVWSASSSPMLTRRPLPCRSCINRGVGGWQIHVHPRDAA
jgi:hypothetical protein